MSNWTIELLVDYVGSEEEAEELGRKLASVLRGEGVTVVVSDVREDEKS